MIVLMFRLNKLFLILFLLVKIIFIYSLLALIYEFRMNIRIHKISMNNNLTNKSLLFTLRFFNIGFIFLDWLNFLFFIVLIVIVLILLLLGIFIMILIFFLFEIKVQTIIIILIYFTCNIDSFLYFCYWVKKKSKNWMLSSSFFILYWIFDLSYWNLWIRILFYIQSKL